MKTLFNLTTYNLEKFNDVITKARCRIFYKYGNRNGTYITDEFAEKLVSTLPYTPIKGIFDQETDDYTDHGTSRNKGRIYGIVPENPNFAWEPHLDDDGVTRIYACTDVYLFTALYSEANVIVERPQSMELYAKNIKGSWQYIDGKRYYVFTEGCFLGLSVLGKEVEPCFEGASFYSLCNSLNEIVSKMEKYVLNEGGSSTLNNELLYKLSDSKKADMIWLLLNPAYNEEGNWQVDYSICDVFDDYALVYNYAERQYERVYYTKDDASDSISLGDVEKCYIIDVSESEKNALEALHKMNGDTFEKIDENFALASDFEQKFTEQAGEISTLKLESETKDATISSLQTSVEALNDQVASLTQENTALQTYKTNAEMQEKQALVDKYARIMDAADLSDIQAKLADYNLADLNKDLAELYVNANQSIFSKQDSTPQVLIPKPVDEKTGLEKLLDKYTNM